MSTATTDRSTSRSEPASVTAKGINGRITVEGDRVMVRKGLLATRSGIRGERMVPLGTIAAVRLLPATGDSDGSLRLVMRGEDATPDPAGVGEYTIRFRAEAQASFEQVRARLDALL